MTVPEKTFLDWFKLQVFLPHGEQKNTQLDYDNNIHLTTRVTEPEPPGAGGFSYSRSRHFGPAPA